MARSPAPLTEAHDGRLVPAPPHPHARLRQQEDSVRLCRASHPWCIVIDKQDMKTVGPACRLKRLLQTLPLFAVQRLLRHQNTALDDHVRTNGHAEKPCRRPGEFPTLIESPLMQSFRVKRHGNDYIRQRGNLIMFQTHGGQKTSQHIHHRQRTAELGAQDKLAQPASVYAEKHEILPWRQLFKTAAARHARRILKS